MIAFVFVVIASRTLFGSSVKLIGSISAKTGVAPLATIAATVATAVCEGVITSSPHVIPSAFKPRIIESVPEFTPIHSVTPTYAANSSSKLETSDPRM